MIHKEDQQAFITIPENLPSLYHEGAFELFRQVTELLSSGVKSLTFLISYSRAEPPLTSFSVEELQARTRQLSQFFMQWEQKGVPLIALIKGQCSGTRFALATLCHYRIGILPDLVLGPGSPFQNSFSICGTALRLTHLFGLGKTIQWMFYQPFLSGEEAYSFSFLHQLAHDVDEAKTLAQEWLREQKPPLPAPLWYSHLFPLWENHVNQFTRANAFVGSKIGPSHHPARFALAALYHGLHLPFERGVALEEKYMIKAFTKERDC